MSGFTWPWCRTHDAPFAATPEGWKCYWEGTEGVSIYCVATTVHVTHTDTPYDLTWTATMMGIPDA